MKQEQDGLMGPVTIQDRELLSPTGPLRVAVFAGSPISVVTDPASGEPGGVCYDLGREFARRLSVPVEYVTFQRIADALAAMKDGRVDFTIANATPVRANDVSFSRPVLAIELGWLVPGGSPIGRADEIDRPGIRIGVTRGSTSERTLPAMFRNATVVSAENVKVAIDMLARGEIDLYATNKPTLFEMADAMPAARVLDGNWGLEYVAVAIPKGREAGLPLLNQFVQDVQASGFLQEIERKVGLRGAATTQDH